MTILVFTSILAETPFEEHQHGQTTLHEWLCSMSEKARQGAEPRFFITIEGKRIAPEDWALRGIKPEDIVRIYPTPHGGLGSIIGKVFGFIGTLLGAKVATAATTTTGKTLSTSNTAKANSAALGDPIREVFGKMRVYPDYVVAPRSRFSADDPSVFYTNLFLCIGAGKYAYAEGDIRIGDTPISSFGDDVTFASYEPGADVSGDERSENWYVSSEVGGTNTSDGLDMGTTSPESDELSADSASASGNAITFNGVVVTNSDDDDDDDDDVYKLPASWTVGSSLEIKIPDSFTVTTDGNYSRIASDSISEIAPYVGMPVTLNYNGSDYALWIADYQPHADTPDVITASITFAYDSATGTPFGGIPNGQQRLSVAHRGNEYKILTIDGVTITVGRLLEGAGDVDTTWPGFTSRTALDFSASGVNDSDLWLGPFLATPSNETTNYFEVNFSFPSGLVEFDKKGGKNDKTVEYEIQYRVYGSDAGWTSKTGSVNNKTIDGCGYTIGVSLPAQSLIEVRCRRTNEQGSGNARDSMYWQSLQARLQNRPARYNDVSTIALKVTVGGRLSAQSDRKVNVTPTRNYDTGNTRSVSAAFKHLAKSAGMASFDTATVDALESAYWTPQGIKFDYIADDDKASVKDVLDIIAAAGRGYFTISNGEGTVGLDIAKSWTGIITPQEMTGSLRTVATAPTSDDYDGVDVTYTSAVTWADEVVQCRMPGADTAVKVESVNADGITDQDKAYQFGMRRLMKHRRQRLTHSCTTEMDALNYEFGDRIILADDIPGMKTITALAEYFTVESGVTTLYVSEPLDWSFTNPRVVLRTQTGQPTALLVPTRINDTTFTISGDYSYDLDPSIEPIRVLFCDSSRVGYSAVVSKIAPNADGTCDVNAEEYREEYYLYDNQSYPGDVA